MDIARWLTWQEKHPRYAGFFTIKRLRQIDFWAGGIGIANAILAILLVSFMGYRMIMLNVHPVFSLEGMGPTITMIPVVLGLILLTITQAYDIIREEFRHIYIHRDMNKGILANGLKAFPAYLCVLYLILSANMLHASLYGGIMRIYWYSIPLSMVGLGIAPLILWFFYVHYKVR